MAGSQAVEAVPAELGLAGVAVAVAVRELEGHY